MTFVSVCIAVNVSVTVSISMWHCPVCACVWAIYPQMCHANSNTLNSGFRNLDQHFNTTRKTKIQKKKEKDKNKTHSTSSKQTRLGDTLHTFCAK